MPVVHLVPETAYKQWNGQAIRPANCRYLIPSNRFQHGFPGPSDMELNSAIGSVLAIVNMI